MKRKVIVLEQDEYEDWLAQQSSFYLANIRGTDKDPNTDMLFPAEIEERREAFNASANTALETASDDDNTLVLEHVTFETGSAELTALSRYQLEDVIALMNANPDIRAMLKGHTDSTGDAEANLTLSEARAASVKQFLIDGGIDAARLGSAGYGSTQPIETNDTEEGRAANRRTEFFITTNELPQVAINL
jgi:cytochrome c oxidase subunit 2